MAGKGKTKTGGRVKGTPNKTTAKLKDMILLALDESGGVEYLKKQAEKSPQAFLALLGKVLPLQVTGEDGGALKVELITAIQEGRKRAAG